MIGKKNTTRLSQVEIDKQKKKTNSFRIKFLDLQCETETDSKGSLPGYHFSMHFKGS